MDDEYFFKYMEKCTFKNIKKIIKIFYPFFIISRFLVFTRIKKGNNCDMKKKLRRILQSYL